MRRLRHEFLKLDVPLESSSSEEEDLDPCEIVDAVFDVQLYQPREWNLNVVSLHLLILAATRLQSRFP